MRGESGNEVTNRLLYTQSKVPIIHVNGEEQNISIVVAVRVSMTINYVLPIYCYHVTSSWPVPTPLSLHEAVLK